MSERCFPTRVLLLNDIHCKDANHVRRGKAEAGLSSRDKGRWNYAWCFCGAGSDDGLLRNMSMTHCHLFQQLMTSDVAIREKYYKHTAVDAKSNGRTQSSIAQCLLLDDNIQLGTVTCSSAIPSSVESLDLAVGCLQRISGSYFISQKLPCMMSLCGCKRSTKNAVCKERSTTTREGSAGLSSAGTESRKNRTRKPRRRDLRSRDMRDDTSIIDLTTESQPSARCTRSVSKQLRDSSSAAAASASAVDASTHASNEVTDVSASCDDSTVSPRRSESNDKLQLTAAVNSAERRTRSAAAAAAAADKDNCHSGDADSLTVVSLNTVTSDTAKSLSSCRPGQKVIANKEVTRPKKLHNASTKRKLFREMSSLSSSLSWPVLADKQLRYSDANSDGVRTRQSRCFSESNTAITAQCEVLVPRLSCSTQRSRQQGPPVSVDDVAVPLKDPCEPSSVTDSVVMSSQVATESEHMNLDAFEREANCDCSELSALSVDVSFDCNDVCSSPASPLPVSSNMQQTPVVPRSRRFVTHTDDLSYRQCL